MKKCRKCLESLDDSSFWRSVGSNDGLQAYCKECSSKRSKQYHQDNKEHRNKSFVINGKRLRESHQRFILGYLSSHPCVDCGESDPIVLEFDHVSGIKKQSISFLISRHYSLKTIQNEIDKCKVRCANCHRRKTYKTLGSYRNSKILDEG